MTALRVLHVDDEPDIRAIVELSLKIDKALEARSCGSGEEALGLASSWNPDVILLDVMMPVMDGPTTLARLKEDALTAGIPVIFLTSRARPRDLERFIAMGAVDVIAKPFDPMTLAAKLRGCMEEFCGFGKAKLASCSQ
jgi:two-component system, OmpR family, response regulator